MKRTAAIVERQTLLLLHRPGMSCVDCLQAAVLSDNHVAERVMLTWHRDWCCRMSCSRIWHSLGIPQHVACMPVVLLRSCSEIDTTTFTSWHCKHSLCARQTIASPGDSAHHGDASHSRLEHLSKSFNIMWIVFFLEGWGGYLLGGVSTTAARVKRTEVLIVRDYSGKLLAVSSGTRRP